MSMKVDQDDRVSSFGFFLRFVLRKMRLRVPQVAQALGQDVAEVDSILYKNAEPPPEGEVERILGVLEIRGLEADALRLLAAPAGTFLAMRRQLDERTAELFESRAALEARRGAAPAAPTDPAFAPPRAGAAPPSTLTTKTPRSLADDAEQARFREQWKKTTPQERMLVAWLLESGAIGKLHEVFALSGWKPAPAAAKEATAREVARAQPTQPA